MFGLGTPIYLYDEYSDRRAGALDMGSRYGILDLFMAQ